MASPDDAGSVAGNPVVTAAAALLRDFANEAESPCVIRVGRDIDPWDERLRHLREMVAMTPELLFATGSEEAGLSSDDPRIERLKLVSDQIGALVSETLEASIEAVEPENASSPSAGFHPTI
jgi:hypothetical protein